MDNEITQKNQTTSFIAVLKSIKSFSEMVEKGTFTPQQLTASINEIIKQFESK